MKQRIQKIIAQSGLTSRRKAEELILDGKVSVNGQVITELGTKADAGADRIEVDGQPLIAAENKVYVMLHKPPGYISALSDPQGRLTVVGLVGAIQERIYPVGRLDYDTEGLLVLTNDGGFANLLQHPRHNMPRTYLVKVKGVPSKAKIGLLKKGVTIDGVKTNRAGIKLIERTQKNSWLEVVLSEGRNRQIKKMFEQIGHTTVRIKRTAFGPLLLSGLPSGKYRYLNKKEIVEVKKWGE